MERHDERKRPVSKKPARVFWPFSPCPEVHHEPSAHDEMFRIVRARFAFSQSGEDVFSDLTTMGWDPALVHNAIVAMSLVPEEEADNG